MTLIELQKKINVMRLIKSNLKILMTCREGGRAAAAVPSSAIKEL